jgi:hypothetical protein
MGFDWNIRFTMNIDTESGQCTVGWVRAGIDIKPVLYDPSRHTIPKHLRKYTVGSGNFFHLYVMAVEDSWEEKREVDISAMYHSFPTWDNFLEQLEELYDKKDMAAITGIWTKEDHEGLCELTKWFVDNNCNGAFAYSF